jgi:hypothetical protein
MARLPEFSEPNFGELRQGEVRRIHLLKLSEKPHELANLLAISRLIAT